MLYACILEEACFNRNRYLVHGSASNCIPHHSIKYDYLCMSWKPVSGPHFTNGFSIANSNSKEISFHSHIDSNTVIATKFCTWHDSCAVVACANICCDLLASDEIMARQNLHRGQKTLVKWAPGPEFAFGLVVMSVFVPIKWQLTKLVEII